MKQAVILAGGEGLRLKKVSGDLPKPMVPVKGKVLLQHSIEQCVQYGIKDIKLLVSYKKETIQNFFGNGNKFGASIQYIYEDKPKGNCWSFDRCSTKT